MSTRRILIGMGAAVLVVAIGLVWQGSLLLEDRETKKQSTSREVKPDRSQPEDWSVVPEASIDLGQEVRSEDSDTKYPRFEVPGRVIFKEANPESVRLQVSIIPANPTEIDRVQKQQRAGGPRSMGGAFANPRMGMVSLLDTEPITRFVKTDEKGKFRIKNAPSGLYSVSSSDSTWTGSLGPPQPQTPGGVTPLEFSVREYAELVGTVVNSKGNPVSSAQVVDGTGDPVTTTNQQGQFAVSRIVPGRPMSNYSIKKSGFAPHEVSLKAFDSGEIREKTFRLRQTASLNVAVTKGDGAAVGKGAVVLKKKEEGTSRRNSVDGFGEVTFEALPPGHYKLALSHPSVQSDLKTVTLVPNQSASVSLNVSERLPVRISTGGSQSPGTLRRPPPTIRVFDGEGNRLRPGFQLNSVRPDGTFEGTIHPEMNRAVAIFDTAFVGASNNQFEFRRSDLPEVKFPEDLEGSMTGEQVARAELHLEVASANFSWKDVNLAKLNVINRKTGSLVIGKGGRNNLFDHPIRLPAGTYSIYGVIETGKGVSLFYEKLELAEGESLSKQLILRSPASISGTLEYLYGSPESLRVGLRLAPTENADGQQSPSYYPPELQTDASADGSFRLDRVPPGADLMLEVYTTDGTETDQIEPSVLERYAVSSLTEGEFRKLPPIVVEK